MSSAKIADDREGKSLPRSATWKDDIRMRSPLPFLALTLLAQVSASDRASSRGIPQSNAARANTQAAMLVLAGQANKGFKYSVPDGTYTVNFPGKPEEETRTIPRQLGPAKILTVYYKADGGKRLYTVTRTQFKPDPRDTTSFVADSIAGTIHGLTKEGRGAISQETRISYKGASGKELSLTMKVGKQTVHIFAVNNGTIANIYLVAVRDTSGKVDDAKTNAFLDSFAFQPR